MEREEDTFSALKHMAESVSLSSRNDNDEVIGVEYYKNLSRLTREELQELDRLWQKRKDICCKERWASQLMIFQVLALIVAALSVAWLYGGIVAAMIGVIGIVGLFAILEDRRVSLAKRNYQDAEQICDRLRSLM